MSAFPHRNGKQARMARRAQRGGPPLRDPLLDSRVRRAPAIKGPIVPEKEMKYVDIAATVYNCDTTGTVTALNLLSEGDDNVANRTGREVLVESVSISGYGQPLVTTGLSQQHRVLIVWDNAANGALAAITDVLASATTTSFPNVNNIARFTILFDQVHVVGGRVPTEVGSPTIYELACALQVRSPTRFSGTTAAIASVQNGALLMITLGDRAAGVTAGAVTIASRVTYSDED